MARRNIGPGRPMARKLAALKQKYLALRAEAGKVRRKEQAVWRKLEKLVGKKPSHLTTVLHKPGRKDRETQSRPPGRGQSLTAVARARGGCGVVCGGGLHPGQLLRRSGDHGLPLRVLLRNPGGGADRRHCGAVPASAKIPLEPTGAHARPALGFEPGVADAGARDLESCG
jgi:hypothetical protein